jgi:hypothetical protein
VWTVVRFAGRAVTDDTGAAGEPAVRHFIASGRNMNPIASGRNINRLPVAKARAKAALSSSPWRR